MKKLLILLALTGLTSLSAQADTFSSDPCLDRVIKATMNHVTVYSDFLFSPETGEAYFLSDVQATVTVKDAKQEYSETLTVTFQRNEQDECIATDFETNFGF
jgi:hypothetical protein